MADNETTIKVNIDTSDSLAQLKLLQQQISAFQQAMRNAGQANAQAAAAMQQNLVNSINATGKFRANIQTIKTSAEQFTESLEKNKMSMGEYFRYAGGASKTFGKLFKSEFETINQVAADRIKTLQTQYIKLGRDANGAMKAIAVKPLSLDMDSLSVKTQMAAQRQQLFNQLMKQGSTQLLNFGKNTQWAGRQLMVGFTVPLTMAGSAAAKAYMEIEQASVKFKRVYGDINTTATETDRMAKSVQALALQFTKYGLAVSDTMDMAATAAAMGRTGADLLSQIDQAAKLSVLGGVDQQKALETTISLTSTFGIATKDLAKNIDFLNAVENQTALSIDDLTVAIPKAAPVIKQLGGDVKDLAFFMTAMKEGGINASEGANAIKSGLASLINPTDKASKFLAGFGINIKGIVNADKGNLKQTVIDFARALDTLDPLNRARAIEQMFGKFQFSRISTLFQNVIKEGTQASKVGDLANQTTEELAVLSEREMKKVSDSPMYKFQKSVQDMQAKLAPVGEAFLKAVTPIVEFVTKILDGFNNLGDGAKNFITILVTAVAGIGPLLLMTFGLLSNGIANIMKLFTNIKSVINKSTKPSEMLGEQTDYMTTEQLKAAAIASSLDQSHAKLKQTFDSERTAIEQLTQAYKNAVQAQQAYAGVPNVPVGNPEAMPAPKKYSSGVSYVPGPRGAGDIVPALLSPGEAVIPAKHAQKYAPVIAGMVAGNLPGFEHGTTGAGLMRQSTYGPLTQKQTEGLQRTGQELERISAEVYAGPYGKVKPTDYGTQISPTTGHSFPAFGVGGVYQKPDGTMVFVKPQMDLTSATAEMRGTQIAREAHGLQSPEQKIGVMTDPTDPDGKRRFIVLESAVDPKFANAPTSFTKDQYIRQLVASLLRGDKDLGLGNLGGDILADVGTAGVFQRASGKRTLGEKINSMEEQAIINLLGVKGGAKRFFAEATSEIAKQMTPAEYDAAIKAEIQSVIPRLDATIAGFGNLTPEEKAAYADMQARLRAGLSVDWGKYQVMHSSVPPKKFGYGGWGDPRLSVPAYKSEAQKKKEEEARQRAAEIAATPEGQARLKAQRAAMKARARHVFLYDPKVAGPLTEDSPIVARMIEDQKKGELIFAYDGGPIKFTTEEMYRMLRRKGMGAGNYRVVGSDRTEALGDLYNVNVYGSKGGIVRRYEDGTSNAGQDGIKEQDLTTEQIYKLLSIQETHGANEMNQNDPKVQAQLKRVYSESTPEDFKKFKVLSNMTFSLPGKLNQAIRENTSGVSGKLFGQVYNTLSGKLSKTAKMARVPDLAAAQQLEDIIGTKFNNIPIVKDNIFAQQVESTIGEYLGQNSPIGGAANLIWERTKQVGTVRPKREMTGESWHDIITGMLMRGELVVTQGSDMSFPEAKTPFGGRFGRIQEGKFGSSKGTDEEKAVRKAAQIAANQWAAAGNPKAPLPFVPNLKGKLTPLTWRDNSEKEGKFSTSEIPSYDTNKKGFGSDLAMRPGALSFLQSIGYIPEIFKLAKGGIIPGTGKPKASVFDIDDTLLDLASFMPAHQAANAKLPKDQRKNWAEEVAKDPKGIPAAIARLKAAQERGNKILLMTARPDSYDAVTIETLKKLGIDTSRVKLISRRDKDYRKPEQMKYDKTSRYMQWYDIEEFYDDMAKTRGAVSLLGINAIDPLKLASGVFSVPGPKGAGDIVPALLSPGEAVIPADKAAQNRGLISQMIAGKLPGYAGGKNDPAPKEIIPGVKAPEPYVAPEPSKTEKFFEGVKNAVVSGAKKIGEATEVAVGGPLSKFLGIDNENVRTTGGRAVSTKAKEIDALKKRVDLELQASAEYQKLVKELKDSNGAVNEATIKLKEKIEKIEKDTEKRLSLTAPKSSTTKGEKPEGAVWKAGGAGGGGKWVDPETGEEMKPESKLAKAGRWAFTRSGGTGKILSGAYSTTAALGSASVIASALGVDKTEIPGIPGSSVGGVLNGLTASVGAAAAAMQAIPGPAGVVVGVIAALITAMNMYNEWIKKLREESYQLTKAMGAGNDAIGKFAEFAKTVSGTEAMNKKREASAGQFFNIVEGKTTFGESYMKTEAGKALVKAVDSSIKAGDLRTSQNLIVQQLSTAIAAGVLTPAQARSIAAQLGKQLNNTNFSMSVTGQLIDMFGPDGKDLTKDPLKIRMDIAKDSAENFRSITEDINDVVKNASFDWGANAAKMGGALVANLQSALEVQQQMADSLQIDYEKRIEIARAAGDTAEATRLQNQYILDQQKLLQANKTSTRDIIESFKNVDPALLAQAKAASEEAITNAYKGTGLEGSAVVAQQKIATSQGTDLQKTYLNSLVASKQIGLDQITTAMDAFGKTTEGMSKLEQLLSNVGGIEANRALGLSKGMDSELGQKFLVDLALKDPSKAKEANDALELAQKTTGVFGGEPQTAKAIIDFSVQHQDKMIRFKKEYDALKATKNITIAVATKAMDAATKEAFKKGGVQKYWETYKNSNQKATFTTEFKQIMAMEGDAQMKASFQIWQRESGNLTATFADFAAYQADRTVQNLGGEDLYGKKAGGGDAGTPSPSVLDQFVEMLRMGANWQQKLTIGWDASYKALKNYTEKSIKAMAGFAVILKQKGVDANIIDIFMGATEEEQNRIVDRRTGQLKAGALNLLRELKKIRDMKEYGLSYVLASGSERLQKDNELYQAALDVISYKEKKINEKYDERIKALDTISKLNEKNNQKEQDALDLADALSKGDIAAAARAAMKSRQNAQKQALEDTRTAIENARKAELENITVKILGHTERRSTLEDLIAGNSERIATAKMNELNYQVSLGKQMLLAAGYSKTILANGQAASKLKLPGFNGSGSGLGNPSNPGPANTNAANIGHVGYDAKGNTVANPYAAGMGALYQQGRDVAWDFKNKKWTVVNKRDPHKNQAGYVQDEKTPGKWIPVTTSKNPIPPGAFRNPLQAEKALKAGEKTRWFYDAATNIGYYLNEVQGTGTSSATARMLKKPSTGSAYGENWQEEATVRDGEWFKIPKDSWVYKVVKSGENYKISYGELSSNLQGQADNQHSTGTAIQASSQLVETNGDLVVTWKNANGEFINDGTTIPHLVQKFARGGYVRQFGVGGSAWGLGTDTIPAMLTPGEFVMKKSAVDSIGLSKLNAMNNETSTGDWVYNYSITVNATGNLDANDVARQVMEQIKRVDSQRIRSNNY